MTSSQAESQGGDGTGTNDSPLANISDEGVVPRSRFKDAQSANEWVTDKFRADYWGAIDRSAVDDLTDGAAPMNQASLRENGQGNNFNINFQRAFAKEEMALAAYHDLADSDENLIQCEVDTELGTPAQREEWAQIFCRGYTRLNRFEWPDFKPRMLMLEKCFIRQGVGIAFRDNEWDWRWQVSRLGDFQISRRDGCSVDDFQCAGQRQFLYPPDVFDWISDEKIASDIGWNVKATKKAIESATVLIGQGTDTWNWEQVQRDAKDNGLWMTKGKDPQVELRHIWVKEFSGKVSHLITSPNNDDDFLFKKENRWESPSDVMTLFTYGIGNGDLYSIRGLGYKIFALENMFNILMSRLGDSTLRSMSYLWQAQSPDGLQDANQLVWGADTIVPQGVIPVEQFTQNIGQNALQMLNMLSNVESINTGTYTASQQLMPGGRPDRKSATEAQIEASQQAILTTSAKVLFYQALDRLHQMTVRALIKRDYPRHMPGGEQRWKFMRYCLDRGMPEKVFYSICCVRAVRSIGMGSPAEQQAKIGAIMQIFPLLDPIAQNLVLRKTVVTNLGPDYADLLVPAQPRVPRDKKDAELESSLFIDGVEPEIMAEEDAAVHLSEHVPFAAGIFAALDKQAIQPEDAIKRLQASIPHIQKTFANLQKNPTKKKEIQQFQNAIAQITAMADKFTQNYQAEQQAMADKQAQEEQKLTAEQLEQQRKDLKLQKEIERNQIKLESDMEQSQVRTEQKVKQDRYKTAATVENQNAVVGQELVSKSRKTQQSLVVTDLEAAQKLNQS